MAFREPLWCSPRPPRAPIDERLDRIVCCVSDGYSLVACCCKLIKECCNMLCADFLLKLEKECMLVGSMLFSLIWQSDNAAD